MRNRRKLLIAALSATVLLGMAVSAASATRLEIPNFERGFRIAWAHLHFASGARESDCPLTLEGNFERRTFAKNNLTNLGRITEAVAGACTRNSMTILRETLPWEVSYSSFTGALPNITGVTLNFIRFSFSINLEGIACLARTTVARPLRGIATVSSGTISGFEAEAGSEIETSGGLFCTFGPAHFSGRAASTTVRGGAETIGLTLVGGPRLSPQSVSFGTVEPSSTTERTVTIENGSTEITVNEIGMATGTYYSISDPNACRGARLAATARCSFIVVFRAPAEPARSAPDTLNVETTGGRLTASVSGSTPDVVAAPSPVEFGRLLTNTLARREVTITAGVEARIESIRMRVGARFAITDPNRCVGTRLAVNGRCTFNVIVETPAETGRSLEDTVVIATSANTIEDVARAST